MKNEIILFENQNVKLEVNMKDETVWLSIDQMSKLFNRDKSVISRHIKTAMNEELSNNSVVAKFATTASDVKEIIRVINDYSKALDLLDDYDHKTLKKAKGKTSDRIISYDDCMKVIGDLKFNESSDLFALERNEGLKAILGSIY